MRVMICLLRWESLQVIVGVSPLNLGVYGDWWQCWNERAPPALHLPHAHDKSVDGHSFSWLTHNNSIDSAAGLFFPFMFLRAQGREQQASETLPSTSSPARVKAGSHVFGECRCGTTTRFVLSFLVLRWSSSSRCLWWSALLPFCTASSGTTTPTSTMSTSASGSAAGYIFLMIISIIYMFITFRLHRHISNVTNMFIFFCIKLLLKLPKFLTSKSVIGIFRLPALHKCWNQILLRVLTTRDGVKDVFYGFLLCIAFSLSNLDRLDHILLRMSSGSLMRILRSRGQWLVC